MAYSEISLEDAWSILADQESATLIDVRTTAEWNFVGTPDLSSVGKQARLIEWTQFPGGTPNPDFVETATEGLDVSQPILLLCRSGARSRAAGERLAELGYQAVYNITAGFEGDLDQNAHRHGGWKDSLPWQQS
ncbi:MAG: rhodanese-like domain-containing protein [Acidimicrobiales bacterium]